MATDSAYEQLPLFIMVPIAKLSVNGAIAGAKV
jgi:hypothetical protein